VVEIWVLGLVLQRLFQLGQPLFCFPALARPGVVYSSGRATFSRPWGFINLIPLPLRARGSAGIRLRPEEHTTPGLIYLTTQEVWLALGGQLCETNSRWEKDGGP